MYGLSFKVSEVFPRFYFETLKIYGSKGVSNSNINNIHEYNPSKV